MARYTAATDRYFCSEATTAASTAPVFMIAITAEKPDE